MDYIITEIVKIIKSENNVIKREHALLVFFLELIKGLMAMAEALEEVDRSLIDETKAQGYAIDRKNERSVITMFGEIRYSRRRYSASGKEAVYPLDKLMSWDKYQKYSTLVVRNVAEVATRMTYRNASMAVEKLSTFTMSHAQMNKAVIQAGKEIEIKQTADNRYDAVQERKRVKVLYLEGDGVVIKGKGGKKLEFHRYQVCEDFGIVGKNRIERVNAKEFVSFTRKQALKEIREYITNTYDLSITLIISNADGGAGYSKADFDDICGVCLRHEHFLDAFHVNEKIKERLCFAPELQLKLIEAVKEYDIEKVE